MKLSLIILEILLFGSVLNVSEYYYTLYDGTKKTVTDLKSGEKYFFTISCSRDDKIDIEIEFQKAYYTSSSFYLYYIGHSSSQPSTYSNEDEGSLYPDYYGSYIYKSSYTVSKAFIYYVSFRITPRTDIDSISIKLTKTDTRANTVAIVLISFFSVFCFCFILCVIFVFCGKCFRVGSSKIESSSQPQNSSPSPYPPEQPQYLQPQPQYMAPPQSANPQYMAPANPQYMAPPQSGNPQYMAPGQLYQS